MPSVQNSHLHSTSYPISPITAMAVILVVASTALLIYHGWKKEYDHKVFKASGIVCGCSILTLIFMTCIGNEAQVEQENDVVQNQNQALATDQTKVQKNQPAGIAMNAVPVIKKIYLQVPNHQGWIEEFRTWYLEECQNKKDNALQTKNILLTSIFDDAESRQYLSNLSGKVLELHIISGTQGKRLHEFLDKKVLGPPEFEIVRGVYDYEDPNTAWIDFANADKPGGGWKGTGAAQDEVIFFEFIRAPLYAFLAEKQGISMSAANELHPTPWMIDAGIRLFVCKAPMSGNNFRQLDPVMFSNHKQHYFDKAPSGKTDCVIGIAAYSHPNKYTKAILTYHAEAFRCACVGAKAKAKTSISTGRWGCGVFKNNPQTMFAIMMMVAKMEGIKLKFYAIPQKEMKMIQAAADAVTRHSCLNELMTEIINDPVWQPPQ